MSATPALAQLAILTLVAWGVRRKWLRPAPSQTAAGAIVMACGIFVMAAAQNIPAPLQPAVQLISVGLLVVWGFIAASFATSAVQGRLASHTGKPVDAFAVGTWVAGTAVMARVLLLGVPAWRELAVFLCVLAFVLWLGYLKLVWRGFRAILASPARLNVTGRILLATVSTQSIVLLAWHLWPDAGRLRVPATALIVAGYLLYGLGLVLIVQRYRRSARWNLADDWDNTNCIVHGAMSITGLAVAYTGLLPAGIGTGTWLYVLLMLLFVEAVEVARLLQRVRARGVRAGALTYHVSQWSRNFTFGMFYAFTQAQAPSLATTPALAGLMPLVNGILAAGPLIVLAFLLVELGLWFSAQALPAAGPAKPACPIVNEQLKEQRP